MKVTVVFTGAVQQQLNLDQQAFNFPQEASFKDLQVEIGLRYGHLLSDRIWDKKYSVFKNGISVLGSDRIFVEESTRLLDGETITIVQSVAGG